MAKRFTDTAKWKKGLMKGLDMPHKLLWLYICDECDHAGVWDVELDIAGMRIGHEFDLDESISSLGDKIIPFDDGEKWFIPSFVDFQYGELNPKNRVHSAVIAVLERVNRKPLTEENKPLISPLQGVKEKEKDKEKEKEGVSGGDFSKLEAEVFRIRGGTLSGIDFELLEVYSESDIIDAYRQAESSKGKSVTPAYVRGILQRWAREGKPEKPAAIQRAEAAAEKRVSCDSCDYSEAWTPNFAPTCKTCGGRMRFEN